MGEGRRHDHRNTGIKEDRGHPGFPHTPNVNMVQIQKLLWALGSVRSSSPGEAFAVNYFLPQLTSAWNWSEGLAAVGLGEKDSRHTGCSEEAAWTPVLRWCFESDWERSPIPAGGKI